MRNEKKHEGKDIRVHRLIFNVTRHLRMLLKVRKSALEFSMDWPTILISELKPRVTAKVVLC